MSGFNDILVAAAEYLPNATHEEMFGVVLSRGLVMIYTVFFISLSYLDTSRLFVKAVLAMGLQGNENIFNSILSYR